LRDHRHRSGGKTLVQRAKSGDLDVRPQATWGMSVQVADLAFGLYDTPHPPDEVRPKRSTVAALHGAQGLFVLMIVPVSYLKGYRQTCWAKRPARRNPSARNRAVQSAASRGIERNAASRREIRPYLFSDFENNFPSAALGTRRAVGP
jgi:hypothetical protein